MDSVTTAADWQAVPTLTGTHVRLEPLTLAHAQDLLAIADDEVFAHLSSPRPRDLAGMERMVSSLLDRHASGEMMSWVQVDVRDGADGPVAGTTSYYEVNPSTRSVAIGYTWLGRPWWRTALNTEAKLLLLRRAFDDLEAVRVVWHTDIRNTRSQAAIARLGAEREGVLRKHKKRADGSWRDTVQFAMTDDDWPAAREHLESRLR